MIRRVVFMLVLVGAALAFAYRFEAPARRSGDGVFDALDADPRISEIVGSTTTVAAIERVSTTTTTTARTTTTTVTLLDDTALGEVFEGSRIYTNWGWVKVEVTVVNDVMVDVELVMLPRATKRSEALATEYEPVLREQALVRQSPDVDMISGATVISDGYRSSLRGAMKAASLWSAPDR